MKEKPAVFFDRDGTVTNTFIRDNKAYAATEPKDLELLKDTPNALNRLHASGFLIIIASNQPDIALGEIDEQTREALEAKFEELLDKNGAYVDATYYCHHHPDSINPNYPKECDCRKPKPGMILEAMKRFNIDFENSWVVGDNDKDVNLGKTAGCRTILIKRPYSGECEPDFTVDSLSEVVDIIIQNS